MDGRDWYDENGWHYEAPRADPYSDRLTLALFEDLSNLLVTHGYPPLRGIALEQIARARPPSIWRLTLEPPVRPEAEPHRALGSAVIRGSPGWAR